MIIAQVRAKNANGEIKTLSLQLNDIQDLSVKLENRNLVLESIIQVKESEAVTIRLNSKETIEFFEVTATLSSAGLNLNQVFDIYSQLHTDGKISTLVTEIKHGLTQGESFSTLINKLIEGLAPIIVGCIQIGEKIGKLDIVLGHLLEYLRLVQKLKEKVIGAALYPGLILTMMALGIAGLSIFFIPDVSKTLANSNTAMNNSIQQGFIQLNVLLSFFAIILFIIISFIISYNIAKLLKSKYLINLETIILKLPLIGSYLSSTQLFTLCFSMELLLKNGVLLSEAIGLSAKSLSIVTYTTSLENAAKHLSQGSTLSYLLASNKVFPEYFIRWIQIAEHTGKTNVCFSQLRVFYEKDVEKMTSRIMSLIEPILIAIIGAILIAVIITVVLPLLQMYNMGMP